MMSAKYEKSTEKVQEFQFHEIPKTTKWESIQKTIYDPDKKEFFGRTKKSWSQLVLFYTIFYTCLAVMFTICMKGLLSTLNDKKPSYILEDSLIGANPGLGFRPISEETSEGSLIWYNLNKRDTTEKWVELIDKFLIPYKIEQVGENYQVCSEDTPLQEGHVCTVKTNEFGPCTVENQFGFNSTSPCVFLKLNRIYGWVPDYHTRDSIKEEMPEDLVTVINSSSSNKVWISCEGENPFDKERISGFRYFPSQGFSGFYFPYMNVENYRSPLIAVQILNIEPSAIVNIECRAWAKNIRYSGNRNNREGSVHFEILVDTH